MRPNIFLMRLNYPCVIGGGILLVTSLTACHASLSRSLASTPSPNANRSLASSPFSPAAAMQNSNTSLLQAAVQVVRDYYSAIARHDYEQAYAAWDGAGAASQQSFEQFKQGFANTASVAVEVGEPGQLEGAAGSSYIEIPVAVSARTTDGALQQFRGSYVLRRVNDVPGSTPEQRKWHLYSANLAPVH